MNQKKDYICVKFKGHEFDTFENEAGKHSFYMSPQKWIKPQNLAVVKEINILKSS